VIRTHHGGDPPAAPSPSTRPTTPRKSAPTAVVTLRPRPWAAPSLPPVRARLGRSPARAPMRERPPRRLPRSGLAPEPRACRSTARPTP